MPFSRCRLFTVTVSLRRRSARALSESPRWIARTHGGFSTSSGGAVVVVVVVDFGGFVVVVGFGRSVVAVGVVAVGSLDDVDSCGVVVTAVSVPLVSVPPLVPVVTTVVAPGALTAVVDAPRLVGGSAGGSMGRLSRLSLRAQQQPGAQQRSGHNTL
ncbi:MAG: hypothetical protein WKF58_12015 [Ilumatobacteraceae bacterium]